MLVPLFSAAALILLIQIPVAATPKTAEKVAPACTVSGRVVTSAEGTPLKSSRVALIVEHQTRESEVYAAVSDADGRFTIPEPQAQ